ncbi:MAG TPA: cupin domain-containing protein [Candidatus Dormibacteraeota bacterium]|jgi:quercetin dioxygenase-like cupin family protein|nr:cupin domain-containing protein [Candidatus Dormibacteraeota bacterium]
MEASDRNRGPLGPIGQRVVYEDERVRVWEVSLEPGEQQPLHRHLNPYLVIAVEGGRNVIENVDGGRREVVEEPGGVVFREAGEVHTLTNVGTTRYVNRLVELKHV